MEQLRKRMEEAGLDVEAAEKIAQTAQAMSEAEGVDPIEALNALGSAPSPDEKVERITSLERRALAAYQQQQDEEASEIENFRQGEGRQVIADLFGIALERIRVMHFSSQTRWEHFYYADGVTLMVRGADIGDGWEVYHASTCPVCGKMQMYYFESELKNLADLGQSIKTHGGAPRKFCSDACRHDFEAQKHIGRDNFLRRIQAALGR